MYKKIAYKLLYRISSFQNQINFNLIIYDSRLFNGNTRIGTYPDQTQEIM